MEFGKDDLFISPNGNDNWSGKLPEPNADGTDGPLKTLAGARDLIRFWRGLVKRRYVSPVTAGTGNTITVWLRDGRYHVSAPIVFEAIDSAPVTYAAYPDETPVIDGGKRITGWKQENINGVDVWVAELPGVASGEWYFRQLFVNGERRQRPRLLKKGLYRMETVPGMAPNQSWGSGGYTQFTCAEGNVEQFKNLQDVEVVYVHFWIEERSTIESFDEDSRLVTMARPSKAPLVGSHGSQLADYYLDNVLDALSEPGEWYLDREAGKLYYIPMPGETPDTTEVYAPSCLQLMGIIGDADEGKYVENLRFQGITFQHTDWRHPDPSDGATFIGPSAGASNARRHRRGKFASGSQAASDVPGVIFMEAARYCSFEDCTVCNIGWYGMEICDACYGIRIVGNTITDMGAGGVKIGGSSAKDPIHRRTGNHLVSDNHIYSGGRVFHSGVGVLSMHAFEVSILHNHIHDLFYSGVSCGWEWGYQENVSRDNKIEKNHIHDLGQGLLSDMGGIYTLGVQPGTVLRGNLIHDVNMAHYGAWCIYPDEGSAHLLIENNVCYRTNGEAFHQHYGRENIVRNNIFAFGEKAQIAHGRVDSWHKAFNIIGNIIVTDGSPVFQGGYRCRMSDKNHYSNLNLIWDISGKPLAFVDNRSGSINLEQWQELGHDIHSINADPKFMDLANDNFTLNEDSPALELGFKPIDISDVGPRPKDKRDK